MRKAPAYQVPERLGFHIVERWQFNFAADHQVDA